MSIVATGSVSGFFQEIVGDAMRVRRVDATDGTTSYIVSLLADYAKPDERAEEALDRPLAFLLDEALHTQAAAERFERLRSLGDGVLYGCGFFRDHFEARGVDQSYLFGIGTTAYGTAASMLRRNVDEDHAPSLDIFGELAKNFAAFVAVLADVADHTIAMGTSSSRNVVKMYERWLKTGSERLAQSLSSHGLVPMRGPKGIQ
jgi:hypothetical protein